MATSAIRNDLNTPYYSISQVNFNLNLKSAPPGPVFPMREIRLSAGAQFIVVVAGDVVSMPGLPRIPAANSIKMSELGAIT